MAHQHRTKAADGTELAWSAVGQESSGGPDIILVHGITESAETWRPVTDLLAGSSRVITLDLRGHGESGTAESYDFGSMAGDVVTVAGAAGSERPHLVGHSLGGLVASAVGAAAPVASVVNVDQSLQLGGFKEMLVAAEAELRDPEAFPHVIEALFSGMRGPLLSDAAFERIEASSRPAQDVVLGVWDLIFTLPAEEIQAAIDDALEGYASSTVPYLSLFGIDPGPDYAEWLGGFVPNSTVEVWDNHGHFPHIVDPERFVERLRQFWE